MRVCYDKVSGDATVTDCPPGTVQYKIRRPRCRCCRQEMPGPYEGKPMWLKVPGPRVGPEMITLPVRFVRQYIKDAASKLRRTGSLVVTIELVRKSKRGQLLVRFGLWHVKKGADPCFEKGTEPAPGWWDRPDEIRKYLPTRV